MPTARYANTERTFKLFHPELGLLEVRYKYVRKMRQSATSPVQPPEILILDISRRVDGGIWVSVLGRMIEAEDAWLIAECFENWGLEAAKR